MFMDILMMKHSVQSHSYVMPSVFLFAVLTACPVLEQKHMGRACGTITYISLHLGKILQKLLLRQTFFFYHSVISDLG